MKALRRFSMERIMEISLKITAMVCSLTLLYSYIKLFKEKPIQEDFWDIRSREIIQLDPVK